MGIYDGDAAFSDLYNICYTSRDDTFADVHNLDQCIDFLNQSLETCGFPSSLDLNSNDPASIARTCNCLYALVQQRQRDVEYRLTVDEEKKRLTLNVAELEAKVKSLTEQLAIKEREFLVITSKGSEPQQMPHRSWPSQIVSHALRQNENEAAVEEKLKVDNHMRQWQELKPKTPVKIVPPHSPLPPKTPTHDRLSSFSPSTKSVKRTFGLGIDCAFTTPRSRFSENAGAKVLQFDALVTAQKSNERLMKAPDFEFKKPKDNVEDKVSSTAEDLIVPCSGSLKLPDENIFLSPHIQYDNPMFQDESPPLSERLKSLEISMRALSPISMNVEPLQARNECTPCKLSHVTMKNLDFENIRCRTPEPALTMQEESPSTATFVTDFTLATTTTSESLTPFQQFKHKNPDLQMTLVKQYLRVLNTATREELLQLKGIGPKRAADVIELRQQCLEPFKDLQDLKSIGLSERQAYAMFNNNIVEKVIFPSS